MTLDDLRQIHFQKSVSLKSFKCKLANQFYFEEMLLFKNTEMQVWKSPAKCEQIYWWGAVVGVAIAAAAILRSPTTFNRLALSLKIIRPAISDETFDQQFLS